MRNTTQYRQRLADTRRADAEHGKRMRELLEGSGTTFEQIRAAPTRGEKDRMFLAALRRAEAARKQEDKGCPTTRSS